MYSSRGIQSHLVDLWLWAASVDASTSVTEATRSNPLRLKWGVDETSTLLPIPTGDSNCAPGGKGRLEQDVKLLHLRLFAGVHA